MYKGHYVSYGVGGPGGADLIGIKQVVIQPEDVGKTMGIFHAVEVKASKSSKLSAGQKGFRKIIKQLGGIHQVMTPDGEVSEAGED